MYFLVFGIIGRLYATVENALLSLVAFVSSTVTTVCYLRIGLYLRIHMKEMTKSDKCFNKSYQHLFQTTKTLAVVTAAFLISSKIPYVGGIIITINMPKKEPYLSTLPF